MGAILSLQFAELLLLFTERQLFMPPPTYIGEGGNMQASGDVVLLVIL